MVIVQFQLMLMQFLRMFFCLSMVFIFHLSVHWCSLVLTHSTIFFYYSDSGQDIRPADGDADVLDTFRDGSSNVNSTININRSATKNDEISLPLNKESADNLLTHDPVTKAREFLASHQDFRYMLAVCFFTLQ